MQVEFKESILKTAHLHSSGHQVEVLASSQCGCFRCLELYPPDEIEEWVVDPPEGKTAICPRCGIDSVLGGESGYPLTDEFLEAMNAHWF